MTIKSELDEARRALQVLIENDYFQHRHESFKTSLACLKTMAWIKGQTPHSQIKSGIDAQSIMAILLQFEKFRKELK